MAKPLDFRLKDDNDTDDPSLGLGSDSSSNGGRLDGDRYELDHTSELHFTERGDEVRVPDHSDFDLTSEVSLYAEIVVDDFEDFNNATIGTSDKVIVGKTDTWRGNTNQSYGLYVVVGDTDEEIQSIGGAVSDGNDAIFNSWYGVEPNTRYRVCMSYDGSSLDLYVNGVHVESDSGLSGDINVTSYDVTVGHAHSATSRDFFGVVDSPAVYGTALTDSEAKSLTSGSEISPTPISRWDLDEGAGTHVEDSVGTHNGTLSGATWIQDGEKSTATTLSASEDTTSFVGSITDSIGTPISSSIYSTGSEFPPPTASAASTIQSTEFSLGSESPVPEVATASPTTTSDFGSADEAGSTREAYAQKALDAQFEDFENLSDWTVNTGTFDPTTYKTRSGQGVVQNNGQDPRAAVKTLDVNGERITAFRFHYWETSSNTYGTVSFYNSDGNRELSVGTSNAQWGVDDGDGSTDTIASTQYRAWQQHTIIFHWNSGTYTFVGRDLESGETATTTRSLIEGKDVAEITIGQGGSFGYVGNNIWYLDEFAYIPQGKDFGAANETGSTEPATGVPTTTSDTGTAAEAGSLTDALSAALSASTFGTAYDTAEIETALTSALSASESALTIVGGSTTGSFASALSGSDFAHTDVPGSLASGSFSVFSGDEYGIGDESPAPTEGAVSTFSADEFGLGVENPPIVEALTSVLSAAEYGVADDTGNVEAAFVTTESGGGHGIGDETPTPTATAATPIASTEFSYADDVAQIQDSVFTPLGNDTFAYAGDTGATQLANGIGVQSEEFAYADDASKIEDAIASTLEAAETGDTFVRGKIQGAEVTVFSADEFGIGDESPEETEAVVVTLSGVEYDMTGVIRTTSDGASTNVT